MIVNFWAVIQKIEMLFGGDVRGILKQLTMKSFTRYYYPRKDGMTLRSGRVINCIMNDAEIRAYSKQLNAVIRETDVTKNKCKLMQTVFAFMDKYHDLVINDINFVNNHRVLRKKFEEFIETFENEYYDSNTKKKRRGGIYFCRCCPKKDALLEDIQKGKPDAFEKEVHLNDETRQKLVKWSMFLQQPHRIHRNTHTIISKKINQDVASHIVSFL